MENVNSSTVPVGEENGEVSLGTIWQFVLKLKMDFSYDPTLALGHLSQTQRNEDLFLHGKTVRKCVEQF